MSQRFEFQCLPWIDVGIISIKQNIVCYNTPWNLYLYTLYKSVFLYVGYMLAYGLIKLVHRNSRCNCNSRASHLGNGFDVLFGIKAFHILVWDHAHYEVAPRKHTLQHWHISLLQRVKTQNQKLLDEDFIFEKKRDEGRWSACVHAAREWGCKHHKSMQELMRDGEY